MLKNKEALIPVVVTVLCLLPFIGKAFHVDDTLFLFAAKQIQSDPADFYGFTVNWYGREMPMSEVTMNPPVTCYYIALVGSLFGYSEIALHIAFLIPAVAAALGIYYLARRFCSKPVLAAMAAVLTPGFLVSSTNVMCDTMMLAFWVWSVVLWVKGIRENNRVSLLAGGILIAICALTKYFGMALLPLLFIYSLVDKRKLGLWVLFLVVPIAILAAYQWLTFSLYGRGLLSNAAVYATKRKWKGFYVLFSGGLISLAFMGGCILTVFFYGLILGSRRVVSAGTVVAVLFMAGLVLAGSVDRFPVRVGGVGVIKWSFVLQFGFMAAIGVSILALAGFDFFKSRNADSLLLLLWVFGTFIFAGFVNWSVNARSILPMTPAVGILLVRRLDLSGNTRKPAKIWPTVWPLIPAAVIALAVTYADFTWANSARDAAEAIDEKFADQTGKVCFQGHWGFQYYMQDKGYEPFDLARLEFQHEDIIIIPINNTNLYPLQKEAAILVETLEFPVCGWLATMDRTIAAGFYLDRCGPLPYSIGKARPEKYYIFVVK